MGENEEKCQQKDKILQMICEVEKLYKDEFSKWQNYYKDLIEATFHKNKDKYEKKNTLNLKWLSDDFVKKYPMFEYLKGNNSNVFSFIVMLNKYGTKKRQEIAKIVLGDEKYKDLQFYGVPSGQQGLSTKTFKEITQKEIDEKLNEIAYNLLNDENLKKDTILNDYKDTIEKLSDTFKNVFFILAPDKFLPSDKNTRKLLEKIDNNYKDKEPIEIEIENFDNRALSFVAWLEENQVENILDKYLDNQNKPKNIILTGIPGTGKTYAVMKYLEDNGFKNENRFEFVQFHPSYDYEDFIEGLKPIPSDNGQIEFKLVNGVFKELCKKAYADKDKTYVMVIDEINRANLSRVFGELLYCLEYRDAFVSTKMTTYIESLKEEEQELYSVSQEHIGKFAIPNNLIILGTMNEVDRSIDAFDLALRRRFIWEEIVFSETALRLYEDFFTKGFQEHIQDLIAKAKKLNDTLKKDIGVNYQLGHTYYFKIIDYFEKESDTKTYESALCNLWEYHLQSILKEYIKVKFSESDIEKKLKEYKEIIVGKNNCDE